MAIATDQLSGKIQNRRKSPKQKGKSVRQVADMKQKWTNGQRGFHGIDSLFIPG
ncbi:hypothetical protein DAPPUDRAFT_302680 [Daphnia pulex]|uniref:Uncharacterized protein n=1 Tax=Daphnia pulex TaxID=6669 RepID=E9HP55_DAPPU|nr:hypothetical protein DAPPUDRAFT_302680 [Daphnia pulex]|eukprot:EFX66451.1 hypothetical protein DAPPUDRAFT_302680 [Daphnia pulex]